MLSTLIAAQDALARLEAEAALAPPTLREGLGARLAVREAAGWLAHHGSWVHPVDLALREAGVTGSYTAAELGMRLPSVAPATLAEGVALDLPEDRDVAAALGHARSWRRLAALPGWSPEGMALPEPGDPALLAAARIIAGAAEGARSDRLSAAAALRGAWVWRQRGGTGDPGLPFWSAPVAMLHRLALAPDEVGVLAAIAEAATAARRELVRLRAAAARPLPGRGKLEAARAEALRRPVLTGRMLAAALGISQRGALDLIGRMAAGGLLREATGRRAWRAFIIADGVR